MGSKEPQVVVITGASSGIGRATAREFGAMGARVVLASRDQAELDDTAREVEGAGGIAIAVATDVTQEEEVDKLCQAAVDRFGRVDVWVNDAAVGVLGRFDDLPTELIRQTIETDMFGYLYGARAAIRQFKRQGHGTLINVASIAGKVGEPWAVPYAMAKSAVITMGASLREELVDEPGIDVATIIPAAVDTPFFQHEADYYGKEPAAPGPVYAAEDVARKIVLAAAKPKPEVYVGMQPLKTRIMQAHMKRLAEKMWAKEIRTTHFKDEEAAARAGILFDPDRASDNVTGGWQTRRRHRTAAISAATVGLAGVVAGAWWLLAGRKPKSQLDKIAEAVMKAKSAQMVANYGRHWFSPT